MKRFVWFLAITISLISCRKFPSDLPEIRASQANAPAKTDTIPDKAALKIKLVKDSTNYDETMMIFNHTAKPAYSPDDDAAYFTGFGKVSLCSVSTDGRNLAIYTLPYSAGMSVGLDLHGRSDGAYHLMMSYKNKIPPGIQILIRDTYLKDSVDVNSSDYYFNIIEADTNTFGARRFKLIIKPRQVQAALPH